MNDVCVHTMTRTGQYLEPVIRSVAPYVKQILLFVDDRSKVDIYEKIDDLKKEFDNLEVVKFHVDNPFDDLTDIRNTMIEMTKDKWIWIVDDDEYWPQNVIESIKLNDDIKGVATMCYAVWNSVKAHYSCSISFIPRIFKNTGQLKWKGKFTKEKLYDGEEELTNLKNQNIKQLPIRYIHLTHVKEDVWRDELNQQRRADDRKLINLPPNIIEEVNPILVKYGYKKEMPSMR